MPIAKTSLALVWLPFFDKCEGSIRARIRMTNGTVTRVYPLSEPAKANEEKSRGWSEQRSPRRTTRRSFSLQRRRIPPSPTR